MSNPLKASKRELTTCPECGVSVRTDRLEKHINNVHRSREKLPRSQSASLSGKKTKIKQKELKHVISRKCPYCQEVFDVQGLTRHLSICTQKPKRDSIGNITKAGSPMTTSAPLGDLSRLKPQTTHSANTVRPPVSNKTYIVDEFGVVQSYNTWWENQNLAENVLAPNIAEASRSARRIRSKARITRIVVCPYCQKQFNEKKINLHVLNEHEDQYLDWCKSKKIPALVTCPYCSSRVRQDRLTNHIVRVHASQLTPPPLPPTDSAYSGKDLVEESQD